LLWLLKNIVKPLLIFASKFVVVDCGNFIQSFVNVSKKKLVLLIMYI
jgi:hypothetical protein